MNESAKGSKIKAVEVTPSPPTSAVASIAATVVTSKPGEGVATTAQSTTAQPTAGAPAVPVPEAPTPILTGDLLADVVTPDPQDLKIKTRLYRCGIKETIEQQMQIGVGGVTFSTQTFRWSRDGEAIKVRGSLQRLTDEQVARMKQLLQYQFLRPSTFNEGGKQRVAYQHIDASDAGHPPKLIPGRMHGDEIPLKNAIEFEVMDPILRDKSAADLETITAADRKRERDELEREELEEMQNFENDVRRGRVPNGVPTTTRSSTALAGLIG